MKIKLSDDWKWDSETDRYEYQHSEFVVTGLFLKEFMNNWGRPIRNVHILAVLDKIYKKR